MSDKALNKFEDTLQDILKPGETTADEANPALTPEADKTQTAHSTRPPVYSTGIIKSHVPRFVEITIRVSAGLAVLAMIILFALRITGR
jgi:hypothetical protein